MAFEKVSFTAGQILRADHLNTLETNIETAFNEHVTQTQFNESAQQIMGELMTLFYTKEEINTMFGTYVEEVSALLGGNA